MVLSGSDIATNSAGVALMNDDLRLVPFLLELARKARGIIALNIAASLVLAIIGLALAATGNLQIWITPFYQAVAYVFVIANSLRLVRFGEEYADAEEIRRQTESQRAQKPTRAMQRIAATS
jgi:cation transport ATPase